MLAVLKLIYVYQYYIYQLSEMAIKIQADYLVKIDKISRIAKIIFKNEQMCK